CVPNSKTVRDSFTLSSAAINADGSFTGTETHDGVLTITAASFPATFSYVFTGNFHAVNSTGVERAAGTWKETVTYNDGTPQTCTTNPLPWSVTRDTQGSQLAAPPPAGSYSGVEATADSFQTMTMYVSSNSSHIQDVTISNRLACVPNSKTVRDSFTLSSAAINADGSFTGTETHGGVLTITAASFPATFSYVFTGNFHA